jgi:multidrug resistance efflux pump
MSWIEKIRQKPQEQKIRLIWITVIIAAIILIALWIITARFNKHIKTDSTLWQTLGQGINDIKNNYKK